MGEELSRTLTKREQYILKEFKVVEERRQGEDSRKGIEDARREEEDVRRALEDQRREIEDVRRQKETDVRSQV